MRPLAHALPTARPIGAGVAIAALTALAMLAIGVGLAFESARAKAELAGRGVTVAVQAADPAKQGARAATLLAMLRRRGELGDVHAVPDDVVRGEIGESGPLPTLIDATLAPEASEIPLVHALAGLPGVSVTRAAPPSTGAETALARIGWTIALLAILCAALVGVGLASAIDADALALFERLGASDAQIIGAATFAAFPCLAIGGAAGALLAVPFSLWQAHVIDTSGMGTMRGWAAMAAGAVLPALLAAIATIAATALHLRRRG